MKIKFLQLILICCLTSLLIHAQNTGQPNVTINAWLTNGNPGTTYSANCIGTTNDEGILFKINGNVSGRVEDSNNSNGSYSNTSLGYMTLYSITPKDTTPASYGTENSALGYQSLMALTLGSGDCALGSEALSSLVVGSADNAIGYQALSSILYSSDNEAMGSGALKNLTTGNESVGIGSSALNVCTIGTENIAIGHKSLSNDTAGSYNVAIGWRAADMNSYGCQNVALGYQALYSQAYDNKKAIYNTNNVAIGYQALYSSNPNSTKNGIQNTSLGSYSGSCNTTGYDNVFIGYKTGTNNAGGAAANQQTGYENTFIGYNASANADGYSNCTAIGNGSIATASNTVVLGNSAVTQLGFNGALAPYYNSAYQTGSKGNVLVSQGSGVAPQWLANGAGFLTNDGNGNLSWSCTCPQGEPRDSNVDSTTYNQLAKQAQQISDLQNQVAQLSAMVSKLDNALAQCCTGYQSTTTAVQSTPGTAVNNTAPYLIQNYPNPYSQNTTISCYVPSAAQNALLIIYDLNGNRLKSLTVSATGYNQVVIDAETLPSGDYLYSLFIDGQKIDTKKMTVIH